MKYSKTLTLGMGILFFIPTFFVHADQAATTSIFIRIETATTTLWDTETEVTACSPTGNGTTSLTGYCAVTATGLSNLWSSYGDDYFLESINGAANDFNTNAYWSWFNDESYGQTALTGHTLSFGEHLLLTLGIMPLKIELSTTTATVSEFGFDASWNGVWTPSASSTIYSGQEMFCVTSNTGSCAVTGSTSPRVFFAAKNGFATSSSKTLAAEADTPTEITPTTSGSGGASPLPTQIKTVDNTKAITFLYSKQQNDGSFGGELYTDWGAIALSATDGDTQKNLIKSFIQSYTPNPSSITDYERHAMTLMSLGINPYSGTPTDYISPIINAFDGTQIGDTGLINDDIFTLFPLLKAGYSAQDVIINSTVTHIVSSQKENGSWNDSVDMTAAALQGLSQVQLITGVSQAIEKGKTYIKGTQASDGGFGSVFSTAWVIQAFNSLGENASEIKNNSGKSPFDSLAEHQAADGGFELESANGTRVWSTSYVIPALLGRSWFSLLSSFSKPYTANTVISTNTQTVSTTTTTTSPSTQLSTPTEVEIVFEAPISEPLKESVLEKEPTRMYTKENTPHSPEQSLAAVAASSPPRPLSDIAVKAVASVVALSGISFLFIKIL